MTSATVRVVFSAAALSIDKWPPVAAFPSDNLPSKRWRHGDNLERREIQRHQHAKKKKKSESIYMG